MTEEEYQQAVAAARTEGPEPSRYMREVFERTRVARVVKFTDGRVTSWEDPPNQYLDDWTFMG